MGIRAKALVNRLTRHTSFNASAVYRRPTGLTVQYPLSIARIT